MAKKKWKYKTTEFMLPTSYYDGKKADRAVAFISQLSHTKGKWAGKKFELLWWQEQIIRDIFGVCKEDGTRQFNTAFITCGKKQGKSELAAAVALYTLCADNEQRAEIYGCANDRGQATIVFDVAKDMILLNPTLAKRCKITESRKMIQYLPTRSFYQAVSADVATKYGLNVHACIFDELLGQPNRKLFDVMTKGSGAARTQPLNFVITTAGNDRNSICYEVYQKAKDLLNGKKRDPTFYPVIFGVGEDKDWKDEKLWEEACPSLGITVKKKFLQDMCESAKANPAEEIQFRQFFLNQWTKQAVRWMPMDKWDKCATPLPNLRGRPCYGGLDLSATTDITAFVLVFPPTDDDDKYYVLPHFWIPADNIQARVNKDHVPYDIWERKGLLTTTEGNVIHYGFVEKYIEDLGKQYNILEIAFDRWGATQLTQNLEGAGFTVVPFGQGYRDMSPPTKELMHLVLQEKIAHGGNEVLSWMVDNIFILTDPAGNIKPAKDKSTEKIDGAVAMIMALDRATRGGGIRTASIYDERGIISI